MNRRDLVQRVLLGGTSLMLIPSALTSCEKKTDPDPGTGEGKITIDLSLADNSSLNTTGGSKIVQGIIVVNIGSDIFVALSSACTHAGCIVGYDPGTGNFKCPCHGSSFTTAGSVVTGPATTPLPSYQTSKTVNILTISL